MLETKNATKRIFDRVHRTGEEIKNDLPNWVERAIEAKLWESTIDPSTGEPFTDLGKWLVANYPLGPGMGQTRYSITYDEFIALCDDRPTLKDMLVKHRPKGKRGPKQKDNCFDNVKEIEPPKTGNSRLYIEERLQRDHPAIWEQYLAGEIKSARQAGIKAGFITDTHDPLKRLKSNWSKATARQRKAFMKWTQES